MNEEEWLTAEYPESLLNYIIDRTTERKRNLFACACCRGIRGFLDSEPDRMCLDLTEREADGLANPLTDDFPDGQWDMRWYRRDGYNAIRRATSAYWENLWDIQRERSRPEDEASVARIRRQYNAELTPLVREVFGNPFRPAPLDPAWLAWQEGIVQRLAEAVYDERLSDGFLDPARLAVLADALTDAGCTDETTLTHLREPGPHVRGCWAIDLLLNKQ